MEFLQQAAPLLNEMPYVLVLIGFLVIVWRYLMKKDQTISTMVKENQETLIALTRESITAQNNMASSNQQVAVAMEKIHDEQKEIKRKVDGLRTVSLKIPKHKERAGSISADSPKLNVSTAIA